MRNMLHLTGDQVVPPEVTEVIVEVSETPEVSVAEPETN